MAKVGLPAWNHREIDILSRNGVEIWAYPLKWEIGPCMPRPEWRFRKPDKLRTLLAQFVALALSPARYLRLMATAVRTGTVIECLLAWDFSGEMSRAGVQHIHCHFGDRKLFTGYYCSLILGLPLSCTVHAYEILANPNPAMFKRAAAACRTIVVQSEFNKNEIIRMYGVDPDRIRIIRAHGDVCDERARVSVKLLIAAQFTEKKGHEVLFRALRKLGRDDITVWVAGGGKLDVPGMARELAVADQTVFLGPVNGAVMSILMDACDVFVLPSRTASDGDREGIPAAIMEAMSHHKPVISTRHAGIPELVPDVLVDENDVDGLAHAIATLADSPALRAELGERNHGIIKRCFSEAAVLELKTVFAGSDDRVGRSFS